MKLQRQVPPSLIAPGAKGIPNPLTEEKQHQAEDENERKAVVVCVRRGVFIDAERSETVVEL